MARRIWITADTHFGHAQANTLFARPFADARQMDEVLIDAINRRVGRRDVLLHLGDFFGELDWESRGARRDARALVQRIRCRRIELVRGNQDPPARSFARLFHSVHEMLDFRVPGVSELALLAASADRVDSEARSVLGASPRPPRVVCCHYPLLQWRGFWKGALHFHGHTHGSIAETGRETDVGVDCWEYQPVALADLVQLLCARRSPDSAFMRVQPMRKPGQDSGLPVLHHHC